MHSYKLKINHQLLEELDEFIKLLVRLETATNDEKIFVATMAQVGIITNGKLSIYSPINTTYTIKLNIAQMFAFVKLSNEYITDVTTYLGNFLNTTAQKIKQQTA